jgi:NAD+ diphosphatase
MLGCYADAQTADFRADDREIEEARWLTKDEARARLANKVEDAMKLPMAIAIAHHLIRDWVDA